MLEQTKYERSHLRAAFVPSERTSFNAEDDDIIIDLDPLYDNGFVDWYRTDVSRGFHIYQEEEVRRILQYKSERCAPNTPIPLLKMYFHQRIPGIKIEVDIDNPLHAALKQELESLPLQTYSNRKNALARIRRLAKKMGLTSRPNDPFAADLSMDWYDTNSIKDTL